MGLEKRPIKSVARLKLQYYGHMVRGSACELSLPILQGAVGGTRHGDTKEHLVCPGSTMC